jgi:anti-sigma factor RsiW
MKPEHTQLMHEILDGEASQDDARVIEGLLAADPAACTEYEELRRLFEGLNAIRKTAPPEGLLAEVLAKMPRQHTRHRRLRQLSSRWRVLISDSIRLRERSLNRVMGTQRDFQGEHNMRNKVMSEQKSKRTLWIGGGIAVVALIIAWRFFDIPASNDMSGTIAPAHRSVAEQPGASDVTGSAAGQAGSPSAQAGATADAAIDAARSDAAKSDAAKFDAAKSDAAKADAARFDAAKSDAAKADAARFDAAKSDAAKADAARFDAAKSDAAKADAARFDAAKSDAAKANAARFDAAKADAAKANAAKFDAAKLDAAKADAAKADAAKADAARANAAKADAARSNN